MIHVRVAKGKADAFLAVFTVLFIGSQFLLCLFALIFFASKFISL